MKLSKLLLFPIIGLVISGISTTASAVTACQARDYSGVEFKYVAYRNSDGMLYFAPKYNAGGLIHDHEYYLSEYRMDDDRGKGAYVAAMTAIAGGSKVWLHCDGTYVDQIYVYGN